ncbi:pyrroline-5-carboxylate reductase [Sphingomonas sp. MM-1]|uniref:pyrroline-5-carboxylate reductase n=1 Tax=Sphingomonas sp. MM-1 TaxID=745310 RepID=UPI0002C0E227|nr:pyrroline-5-carboxylate reductase [Sphingomonas sp. MM-1]
MRVSKLLEGPLWLVGAGNMGGAMLRGWLAAGIDPDQVIVIDPGAKDLPEGVIAWPAPPPDGAAPAVVVLAVKPQLLDTVAPAIAPALERETLLISILAGVEVASLRQRFPAPEGVVRVMPNTPVAIGKGVMALHGAGLSDGAADLAGRLTAPLGLVEWIAREDQFDAVTALSGCGPAFLFRFIDAMADAGTALGLPADQAARLALATVEGAALLAAGSDETPGQLADRVASPGGSTREGMNVLDHDGALKELMARTLSASARRNAEMAAAARG